MGCIIQREKIKPVTDDNTVGFTTSKTPSILFLEDESIHEFGETYVLTQSISHVIIPRGSVERGNNEEVLRAKKTSNNLEVPTLFWD